MLNLFNLDKLIEALTKYIDVRSELFKLQLKESAVYLLSVLIFLTVVLTLILSLLFFSAMAFGFWLNTVFESQYLGFVIIAAIYLVPLSLMVIFRDTIIKIKLFSSIFESAFEEENKAEN